MIKVLHLFYLKDDGFTSNEMYSSVKAVIKDPVIFDELLARQQNLNYVEASNVMPQSN